VLAIVGPTAVGKTAVAEDIAARHDGEIVSADSMQIYRGMDVGTAKPPPEVRRVPYHCLDLVDPGTPYSAGLFQAAAREAIADISRRERLPVLVGGTGLYVRAALDDWTFPAGEQTANPVRTRWEAFAAEHGPEALHAVLAERDPASAALVHAHNVRRVVRALEMLETGDSYAEQHAGFARHESVYDARVVGLTMAREHLYERVDARVDAMLAAGLLGEVERLLRDGLLDALTAQQAIGYKELVSVVEGGTGLEEAVDAVKRASRRYAKRQLTWFRADPRVVWFDVTEVAPEVAAEAIWAALDWSATGG
jgi:tRNA dimethylallyltransferase